MNSSVNRKHSKETYLLATSRMLERAAYYGFRTTLVLYLSSEVIGMTYENTLRVHGLLPLFLLFSPAIGAILGDLAIGNRMTILLGGLIQTIGALGMFFASQTIGFYVCIALIALGNGLYSPNVLSSLGKLYLRNAQQMDAGFMILHLAANIGAFLGIIIIGLIIDWYGWNLAFGAIGLFSATSLIPIFLMKRYTLALPEKFVDARPVGKSVLIIAIIIILIALFWGLYQVGFLAVSDIQFKLYRHSNLSLPTYSWTSFNTIGLLPIGLLATIVWSYRYSSTYFKLGMGFVLAALSFSLLIFIPEIPSETDTVLYFVSMILLCAAEIYIAPVLYSVIAQYSNPKYLTLLIGLTFLSGYLSSVVFNLFDRGSYITINPMFQQNLIVVVSVLAVTALAVFICLRKFKNFFQ